MSEPDNSTTEKPGAESDNDPVRGKFNIVGQYIKDMSFENPNAPGILRDPGANAQLEFSVNVTAQTLSDDEYEVDLDIKIIAKNEEMTIYNFEVVYSGIFRLTNIPQNAKRPVLFVTCPAMLFPFVRRLSVDLIREGGFPPPMIDPIDFASLYQQQTLDENDETQH